MNWMTSGKHRALYSRRGRRRQMHFPSQVQRQRVQPASPPRSSQPRDSATPWYIVSVGDDDESQDIRVLELERKGAMSVNAASVAVKARETEIESGGKEAGEGHDLRSKRAREQEEGTQDGRKESRCIFTPLKKARTFDRLPAAVQRAKGDREERPPSSIASGVDVLFFNDGEELRRKNRAQRDSRATAEPIPFNGSADHFSMHATRSEDPEERPQLTHLHNEDEDERTSTQQLAFDDCNLSNKIFLDNTSGANQLDFVRWGIDSDDSGSDTTFARPENESPRMSNTSHESPHGSSPSSPVSPLSFRMSRAEVLHSQLSSSALRKDQQEPSSSLTRSPCASPSPSTPASSPGSIVLDRPPPGWQKRMMLSLSEKRSDAVETPYGSPRSPDESLNFASPRNPVSDRLKTNYHPNSSFALPSPKSSTGSDGDNSIVNTLVPIDARERILAAISSQQVPETSQAWFQPPALTKSHGLSGPSTALNGKGFALQQSWTMSSRTKTIFDAVSASKRSCAESLVQKRDTKYQEMESVAIYMYTLVQCYKIDENLRADKPSLSQNDHAPLSPAASPSTIVSVTKQAASRRELIFSPKHSN